MNKKLLFLPLISCALLTSCAGEDTKETTGVVPQPVQGKSITFEVAPLSVETKSLSTKVDVKPSATSDELAWTNEQVSFLFFENENKQFETTFEVTVREQLIPPAIISMKGDRPATKGEYHVIALSPAGNYFKDASFQSTLEIPEPQEQDGSSLAHLSDYIYLYSHPTTLLSVNASGSVVNGSFPLEFQPLNSLVRFDVYNESTKRVTLNSISIKFSSGGSLYTSASLQEGSGALTYSDAVETMTLDLTNASINGGAATPFAAYMAAWESNNTGSLEIILNISPDGENAKSLIYDLNNVSFERAKRTHIDLNIEEGDVQPLIEIGEFDYNSLTYKTYSYSPVSGSSISWMMTNLNYTANRFGFDTYVRNCPPNWRAPLRAELNNLTAHLATNPHILSLFADAQLGPSYYIENAWGSMNTVQNNKLYFSAGEYVQRTVSSLYFCYENYITSIDSSDLAVDPDVHEVAWYNRDTGVLTPSILTPVRCVKTD